VFASGGVWRVNAAGLIEIYGGHRGCNKTDKKMIRIRIFLVNVMQRSFHHFNRSPMPNSSADHDLGCRAGRNRSWKLGGHSARREDRSAQVIRLNFLAKRLRNHPYPKSSSRYSGECGCESALEKQVRRLIVAEFRAVEAS
jgi:hypothetical protein